MSEYDDVSRLAQMNAALLGFVALWDRAEMRHGCYDYYPTHHPRCARAHNLIEDCTCGRDDLLRQRALMRELMS